MSSKTFHVTIARIDGPVFSGEARSLTVPGVKGEMTILANHTALVSPLANGTLTVVAADGTIATHPVLAGTMEVSDNQATVLL